MDEHIAMLLEWLAAIADEVKAGRFEAAEVLAGQLESELAKAQEVQQ